MKEAYAQQMALLDYFAETNPNGVLEAIRGQLRAGKFMIVPESLHEILIPLLKEKGWTTEDVANLHASRSLRSIS